MGVSWGKLIFTVAVQAWYYANIYRMADGKSPRPPQGGKVRAGAGVGRSDDGLGCMRAVLINESEESRVATALKGIDSHGTHYNPRPRSLRSRLKLILIVGTIAFAVVRFFR